MTTSTTRVRFAVVVGAAIAGAVGAALLLLGADTAQAVPDVADRGGVAIPDDPDTRLNPQPGLNPPPGLQVGLGGPDTLPSVRGFDPQPDPPSAGVGP
jgi:hypothetical protein